MSVSSSSSERSDDHWEQLKDAAIKQARKSHEEYLYLGQVFQEDPEICLAALLAMKIKAKKKSQDDHRRKSPSSRNDDGHDKGILEDFFNTVFEHMPEFPDHRPAFLRFVELGGSDYIQKYVDQFGSAIYQDEDFLKDVIQLDRFAHVYQYLPQALRSDSEIVTLAAASVADEHVGRLAQSVPTEALLEYESILFRALEQKGFKFDEDKVPGTFWSNRNFILKWVSEERRVPIDLIPSEMGQDDRELCLELCRSQGRHHDFDDVVSWIPQSFLAEKSFVLECLSRQPTMFDHCSDDLRNDFDVLVQAAARFICDDDEVRKLDVFQLMYSGFPKSDTFQKFLSKKLGDATSISFVNAVRNRIEAHAEFMTFLACLDKSHQLGVAPLSILDCDEETGRGLKTIIAKYLGFPNTDSLLLHERIFQESITLVIKESPSFSYLKPHIPTPTLVQAILETIERGHCVNLTEFPEELWYNRIFVKWAAKNGMFHSSIPDEFSSDAGICLAYYGHSAATREKMFPWISESLKLNPTFVRRCLEIDPLVLNLCKTDAIRYNFDVLLAAVQQAMRSHKLDDLADVALSNGWSDSLVYFAKELRAKMEARCALETFQHETRTHLFSREPRVMTIIGSYLGVKFPRDTDGLKSVWKMPFIFCLAVGGNVEELCKAHKFRLKKRKCEEDDDRRFYRQFSSYSDED